MIVIGAPNSGKSRVLQELTNAQPEVAAYPFTTREPLPGMMDWEDVHVQLIDTPPITEHHIEPNLTGFVRSADAVLLCFDGSSDDAPDETAAVIEQLKSRKTQLDTFSGLDEDDLSIVHVRTLLVVTRAGDADAGTRLEFLHELVPCPFTAVKVELDRAELVAALRTATYDALHVIRAYTKKPGKPAVFADPYTIPRGGAVEDLAPKVHQDLAATLKYARIWAADGTGGQTVGRDHVLSDRDVVELHA